MPGVKFTKSWMPLMPTMSRLAEVKAETATGTSCSDCSRFSAVTTSSSISLPPDAAASAGAAACASAACGSAVRAKAEAPRASSVRNRTVGRDI